MRQRQQRVRPEQFVESCELAVLQLLDDTEQLNRHSRCSGIQLRLRRQRSGQLDALEFAVPIVESIGFVSPEDRRSVTLWWVQSKQRQRHHFGRSGPFAACAFQTHGGYIGQPNEPCDLPCAERGLRRAVSNQ